MASRHLARSIALQALFEWDFYHHQRSLNQITKRNIIKFGGGFEESQFVKELTQGVKSKIKNLDEIISIVAPERPIEQLGLIERNILRLGLFELLYSDPRAVPPKVAINEAIELSKRFGTAASPRFINGVLGTVYREIKKEQENKKNERPFRDRKKIKN